MRLAFARPEALSDYHLNDVLRSNSYGASLGDCAGALAKVINEEIFVPLILPEEKQANINRAIELLLQAARQSDMLQEQMRIALVAVIQDLYHER